MRGAFVVKLGPEARPTEGQFEGWVEEVDSAMELRFRSSDELLKFMATRFALALRPSEKLREANPNEPLSCNKKGFPKGSKST